MTLRPWVALRTRSVFLALGITFLTIDTFLNNGVLPCSSSTLTPFFLTRVKGLGSYFVVNVSKAAALDFPDECLKVLLCVVYPCMTLPLTFSACHWNVRFGGAQVGERDPNKESWF